MDALSREDFRQWLVAKEPDEVVGIPREIGNCPGAEYVKELTGAYAVAVNYRAVWLCDQGALSRRWKGSWLCDFAGLLDATCATERVTAKQALEVLDSLDVS